jgi:hypothetical protein
VTTADAEFSVFCPGVLEVLSIGKGDLKLSVGGDNPEDIEKARALINEMLQKGYAIFVETDDGPERVRQFNPHRMTYLIDLPDAALDSGPAPPLALPAGKAKPVKKAAKRKPRRREVPVAGSRATAVGRTAGG